MSYEQALEAFQKGDSDEAEQLAQADLERATAEDDAHARVDALCMLARVALRGADLDVVRSRAEEARAVAKTAGDRRLQRMPLHLTAVAARMSGQLDNGRKLYLESIKLNDELDETRMAALEHRNLAYLELRAGDPDRARWLFGESRRRFAAVDTTLLAPYLTFDEASVAALDGDLGKAAEKLAEADEQFRTAGVVPDPDDAAEIARLRASLRM